MRGYVMVALAALSAGAGAGYVAGSRASDEVAARLERQARQLSSLSASVTGLNANCGRVKVVSLPSEALSPAALEPGLPAAPALAPPAAVDEGGSETAAPNEQYVHGQELLSDALRTGAWTEKDADELRGLTASLALEDRSALLEELSVSLNTGKLRYDGDGPPF